MKLWLKTKDVKFTFDEETKTITGTVDKEVFINKALNGFDVNLQNIIRSYIYNNNVLEYNDDEILFVSNVLNSKDLYLKDSPIQVHKEMLIATARLMNNDEYSKSDGKRIVMLKLNKRFAKYLKLIVNKMSKILCLNQFNNFMNALDAELKKY